MYMYCRDKRKNYSYCRSSTALPCVCLSYTCLAIVYLFLPTENIHSFSRGTMIPPSRICVGWYTSRGTVITESPGSPLNTIFMMGMPRVSDLWELQNIMAVVSVGWKSSQGCVVMKKIIPSKAHCRMTIRKTMEIKLRKSRCVSVCRKVSQNVV